MRYDLEVDRHDDVTRTIIIGMLVDYSEQPITVTATKIMEMLKRRGYAPSIKYCNTLLDGTNV